MAINTALINNLLRPGLDAVFGNYDLYPDEYKFIFKTYTSEMNYEIDQEMKYLGAADIKPEGAPTASDTMGQRHVNTYLHKTIALMFSMTQEAVADNLYTNQFPQHAGSLKKSLKYTKETLAANVLNQAFNAAYVLGDGQPLCSAAHPIDGGTYANIPTGGASVDFSESAIEQAIITIQQYPAASGLLARIMPELIVIPPALQFSASRLLKSTNRTDTNNNDINALYHDDYIPKGYKVNHYLNSPTSYFIITNCDNAFKHYQRESVKTDSYVDFSTGNIMFKAWERYSFGCSNARGVWGSQGV